MPTASTLSSARMEDLLLKTTAHNGAFELAGWREISVAAMSKLLAYVFSRSYTSDATGPMPLRIGSQAILAQLFRMRFFSFVATDASVEPILHVDELARHERAVMAHTTNARFLPYERVAVRGQYPDEFYANCGIFLTRLQSMFESTLPLLGYLYSDIKTFYRPSKELIENIHLHSGSWGFGAARISNEGLEISYGDLGCGIHTSLLSNPEYTQGRLPSAISEIMTIHDAFEWGVTRVQGEHRGTGLYEVRDFTLKHGGAVECRSGRSRLVFTPARTTEASGLTPIAGVQITIFLPALGGNDAGEHNSV